LAGTVGVGVGQNYHVAAQAAGDAEKAHKKPTNKKADYLRSRLFV
jgi:hypothetical protein